MSIASGYRHKWGLLMRAFDETRDQPDDRRFAAASSAADKADLRLMEKAAIQALSNTIERLRAQGGVPEGWQDISSAPKDRRIRVWSWGEERHARWNDDKYARRPKPFWEMENIQISMSRAKQPTHWMDCAAEPGAALASTPAPVGTADIPFKSELKRRGHHNPMNAVLAENIIAAGDKWIGAGMIDAAIQSALDAAVAVVRNALQWYEDHRKVGPIPQWVTDGWAVHAAAARAQSPEGSDAEPTPLHERGEG